MGKARARRSYDSSGRQRRAQEGQERVLAVARRLFAERGYAETTMEAIANAAEVALPTVYAAFGSKRGVLSRLLDALVSGDPQSPSVLQTEGARQVFADPDRERAIARFAAHIDVILDRVGPINDVMRHAARTEPDVAEFYAKSQSTRLANMTAFAGSLAHRGPLREGLSVEEAGRTIWALASYEVRQLLLGSAAFSPAEYSRWLGETLTATLLPAKPQRRPRRAK